MKYFINIVLLCVLSCSSVGEKKENNSGGITAGRFRYVNLNIIFDYLSGREIEARDIKKRREDLVRRIDEISSQLESVKDEKNRAELVEKQKQYRSELAKAKTDEELYKSRLYNRIDKALENIAKKSDIDFVFSIGDGAVYAKKEYDITEELLREIIKQAERSTPAAR
jgi:hypothetical protein